MRYHLIAKGDGAQAIAQLRSRAADLGHIGWVQVSDRPTGGDETVLVIDFDSEDRVTIESALNIWLTAHPADPPYPAGALLFWSRL